MKTWLALLAIIFGVGCAMVTLAEAATPADEDWQAVVGLDAGPTEEPQTRAAAAQMVQTHLTRQERALRNFLASYPQDARGFEARLRLARLLQIRADFDGSERPRAEAQRLLNELEKTATAEQRPELDFAKIARLMRNLRAPTTAQREEMLRAARQFQAAHPNDRRLASVLAEVATLFDHQPTTKEALLEDARAVATDEELQARIADDLKRVRLLGQEVPLRFTSVQGPEIDRAALQGRPVFVIFFAQTSPPSMTALAKLQQETAGLPKDSVRVVGVSLDEKRETVTEMLKARGLPWPVAWDGQGWQGPLVRELGINALPTVWLLDARGRLRSLNALEGAAAKARGLLQER